MRNNWPNAALAATPRPGGPWSCYARFLVVLVLELGVRAPAALFLFCSGATVDVADFVSAITAAGLAAAWPLSDSFSNSSTARNPDLTTHEVAALQFIERALSEGEPAG